jgi:hypothetical protein
MLMLARLLAFSLGMCLALWTVFSAVKTFVLPRSAPDSLTGLVFRSIRLVFHLLLSKRRDYATRDRVMAYFAPLSLIALLPAWLSLLTLGYTAIYWAMGVNDWQQAFRLSGSSLLTLGYASGERLGLNVVEFTEATLGLMLVALLIAYLPSIYSAFSRREAAVTLLEVRAGNPPSAVEMIQRYHRNHGLDQLGEQWEIWETWFAELKESHTSLAALVFFRSPQASHSWVTAAGTVLDAAAMSLSALDIPYDPRAALCIRAGYLALRSIAEYFRFPYNPTPFYPQEPISLSPQEFERALEQLAASGVPIKAGRSQAWQDFAGWRVNYDSLLLALANLTMAPPAPWTGERSYQA